MLWVINSEGLFYPSCIRRERAFNFQELLLTPSETKETTGSSSERNGLKQLHETPIVRSITQSFEMQTKSIQQPVRELS